MFTIAIVEDEQECSGQLINYIQRFEKETGQSIRTESFKNGILFLENFKGKFDAVFMDISMPLMDGLECSRRMRQKDESVPLIFTTYMAQYAIKGYEVDALAFLVKPISYEDFSLKLKKALKKSSGREAMVYNLTYGNKTQMLNIRDITYIEVYNHNLLFHTADRVFKSYGKLSSIEEDGRFSHFVKVSKSHLVNSTHITTMEEDTITINDTRLPISRRRRKECLEKMAKLIGGKEL